MLVFLTVGYFQNSRPGWNVNSQFALACALAERGTFAIDDYHDRPGMKTGDKAFYNGHFYTDKSPVVGMLGAPIVWAVRQLSLYTAVPFNYDSARWLTAWIVVGGSAALLVALLALLFGERGVAPADAARGAVFCVAATPLLGYSILFFHYLPACAMLMLGVSLAQRAWRENIVQRKKLFLAGLFIGLACWTLNTVALAAIFLTLILIISNPRRIAQLLPWAAGGIVGMLGYFIHNRLIFDSFASAYAYEYDPYFRESMSRGLMGATWPPKALPFWLVTFHPFQGMFLWFPYTLLLVIGCVALLIRGKRPDRLESFAALGVLSLLLLYNSAYYMWWGGWAYAPRHLFPALPLIALGVVPWLRRRATKAVVWIIAFAGFVLNAAAVAVDPQVPPGMPPAALEQPEIVEQWTIPFIELQWLFWKGGVTDNNFGTAMGLKGPISMLPLALLWLAAWLWLPRWIGKGSVDE